MRGRLASIGARESMLSEGWNLILTEPGACAVPHDIPLSAQFIPAPVPGTVAAALEKAGLFDRENPEPLNMKDAWYLCRLFDAEPGEAILRFGGLATICNVFLNGQEILFSESMFTAHELPVTLSGGDELALCFRALGPRLSEPGPRARWRPQMITPAGLKNFRTTLLGHMPGWCPDIHAVGPWRPISLVQRDTISIDNVSIRAVLEESGVGRLSVSLHNNAEGPAMLLRCGGMEQPFEKIGENHYSAILKLSDIEPWWPHTHGTPRLYDLTLVSDGEEYSLGSTGFRRIDVDRGADGEDFALLINGERVFCRGAVWTTADIARLPGGRADYEPFLQLACQAGMNMIRIGGTMVYETPDFFALCDELGLLVWQDFMFANFDYPRNDKAFLGHVHAEIEEFLYGVQASPSLAVLCGGSEIHQQAAMLGLPMEFWSGPVTDEIIPAIAARMRPDVPYVPNSPYGGAMPFSPNAGIAHYYGVGAYMRPIADARRADVRFASESLAFAHVPQQRTLQRHLDVPAVHSPQWKARVPRDRSASWDFEDVRDFYLELLYDFDPARLRREDQERYLDFSRAVTGEVIEETFAEWRRKGSGCNGGLVWTLQDLLPGPGWGVIDSTGEPKPVWYAMRRAFRPVQAVFTDEGTNGLDVHVVNETDTDLDLELEVVCLRDGKQQVVSGNMAFKLAARSAERLASTALFGAFFDTTYAFRFGPPAHDASVARLRSLADGAVLAESFHFPCGRGKALHDASIEASLGRDGDSWIIDLRTDRLAQSVHIDVEGYRADDDWFHLAPGRVRRVKLSALSGTESDVPPTGEIRSLGSSRRIGLTG
ncbi:MULTISPECIES: glycoside hydrolase family 2 protein [Rhizobium]|uniref:glycoside hydrolase family 2 protein n=1 Tax=Rhizobium TaxID=379 RepID=UPI0007EB9818|nr:MULTISPECIES: glycoside hydrolase family 2 protein [Rhizobium]ANK93635.1 glycoside hydrolase family 2 protein [Rhizobium sp. N6212]ANK99681.1 glycoside hydrolase family 2 protein [Rhizobium sp. N621]ANL05811.1 glycoside hydrolase family 2 protein [Rhizobium esperanzae]ANL11865.1 glycoside hydrolase family 2 protein [Rhizobium sp. N1341]ANL23941.1 glycoside hydrolase family 2 protein [Rhizobium sp. N113]